MLSVDIMNYVKPELIIVSVVLYIVGMAIKKAETVKNKNIPYIIGSLGIFLCGIWVIANSTLNNVQDVLMAVFTSIVQGVLVAGLSTYVNQLIKQSKE